MKITTYCAEQTMKLGETLAGIMENSTCIYLIGEMASGKTQFTRGIARGLGLESQVCSPTFAIINTYDDGSSKLYHMDAYRLDDPEELDYIGFFDIYRNEKIVIEWADIIWDSLYDTGIAVNILPDEKELDTRHIEIKAYPDSMHILKKLEEIYEQNTCN